MTRLSDILCTPVLKTEDFGVDGDFLEAGLCAWIAFCTINGLPANVPAVTGASGPRILGGIYS